MPILIVIIIVISDTVILLLILLLHLSWFLWDGWHSQMTRFGRRRRGNDCFVVFLRCFGFDAFVEFCFTNHGRIATRHSHRFRLDTRCRHLARRQQQRLQRVHVNGTRYILESLHAVLHFRQRHFVRLRSGVRPHVHGPLVLFPRGRLDHGIVR